VALAVGNVRRAIAWLNSNDLHFAKAYEDKTFAFLEFANVGLSLVVPDQHPPHVAFLRGDAERFGDLKAHRDGTSSIYLTDPFGNVIEILKGK
jgi:hypothetical protein